MAPERPPQILQIFRDPLTAGREEAFDAVEKDAARVCARLGFPNPHLAIESLSGPKEVWWLNAFVSEADRDRVSVEYARNSALVAALDDIAKRKEGLTGIPVSILTAYRMDLSRGVVWKAAGARFVVVTMTSQDVQVDASVFEASDGTRYILRPEPTREEADRAAAASGPGTTVFAVRPHWGMAAREWVAADGRFWSVNPMAGAR